MARLFGLIGNRADLAGSVLDLERDALLVDKDVLGACGRDAPVSWGVGFFQAGEFLLRRKPSDDRRGLDLAALASGIRSDLMIGHVRAATVGSVRTENTHPFRCRDWLFAHTGSVSRWDGVRERLLESIPEFLRRNIRGDTDSEVLFHLVLSFLHDAGGLDRATADPAPAKAALRSSLTLLDRLSAEEGGGPNRVNALLTSPELMIALVAGEPAAHRTYAGNDFERILGEGELGRMRVPDYASSSLALFASDFDGPTPKGWTPIPSRSLVTFERGKPPRVEQL